MIAYTFQETPIGPILLTSTEDALTGVYFAEYRHGVKIQPDWVVDDEAPLFLQVREQLALYFEGKLRRFSVPLALRGTPFQCEVWRELQNIPYGETITYRELARRVDRPQSVRAVGQANGRNPISIIVPCHRVIGSDGKLTGYGGGLERKEALLRLEKGEQQVVLPPGSE